MQRKIGRWEVRKLRRWVVRKLGRWDVRKMDLDNYKLTKIQASIDFPKLLRATPTRRYNFFLVGGEILRYSN